MEHTAQVNRQRFGGIALKNDIIFKKVSDFMDRSHPGKCLLP